MKDSSLVPIVSSDEVSLNRDLRDGKKQVQLVPKKGKAFDTCSAKGDDYVCCNVKVLKAVSNCPYECSYCFLQDYLTNTNMQVVSDTDSLVDEVLEYVEKHPSALTRVGTWELGDSLALEHETGQARKLIEAFAHIPEAVLELKTKSDCVDTILDADHRGRTVVSWSMNSDEICRKEEYKTAGLTKRIQAAKKCQLAGYKIGLHFEPLMIYEGWESGYRHLIDSIFSEIDPSCVAWMSMGSLRFNPKMRFSMQRLYPGSKALDSEMVSGPDGKMRYLKPHRKQLYRVIYKSLCDVLNVRNLGPYHSFNDNTPMLYLCMERWDMFRSVFGQSPLCTAELEELFTQSLRIRFSEL